MHGLLHMRGASRVGHIPGPTSGPSASERVQRYARYRRLALARFGRDAAAISAAHAAEQLARVCQPCRGIWRAQR